MDFSPRYLRIPVRFLSLLLAAVISFHAVACGVLLHPERIGQPHCGRLDPAIVALDGVGLLLFLVPGIIAFIVDFATGTIYLPPEHWGAARPLEGAEAVELQLAPGERNQAGVERVLTSYLGQDVDLDDEDVEIREVDSVDEASENWPRFTSSAGAESPEHPIPQ